MRKSEKSGSSSSLGILWRYLLLLLIVVGSLIFILSKEPFGQDQAYHNFADQRTFFRIPNFFDVVSNIPFLIIGAVGMSFCHGNQRMGPRSAWQAFFTGVAFVGVGSAYYHLNPGNGPLVWDRLPMTIGFMGLFVALLAEYVSIRLGGTILIPALLLGLFSVLYWHWFDDLRFYYWIQMIPLLLIPVVMILFRSGYSRHWLLLVALGCYLSAKFAEAYDREIFNFTRELFSGHSLKHLLAALGCFLVLFMLKTRRLAQFR